MIDINNRKADEYLERLKKRLNHLDQRILMSDVNLTFDKAEASALRWAIAVITERRGQ